MKTMKATELSLFEQAAGLGAVSGLRSLTPPALVSYEAADQQNLSLSQTAFAPLASPQIANILKVMALGELIVDKLPFAPDRTAPPSLAFRAVSGALVGSALFTSRRRPAAGGAVVGALAAVAATYGAFHLRRYLVKQQGFPDPLIAVLEDLLAIGSGLGLLKAGLKR